MRPIPDVITHRYGPEGIGRPALFGADEGFEAPTFSLRSDPDRFSGVPDVITHRYGPEGIGRPALFGKWSQAEKDSVSETAHVAAAPFRLLGIGAREVGRGFRSVFRPPEARNLTPLADRSDEELAQMVPLRVLPGYGCGGGTAATLDHRYRW